MTRVSDVNGRVGTADYGAKKKRHPRGQNHARSEEGNRRASRQRTGDKKNEPRTS